RADSGHCSHRERHGGRPRARARRGLRRLRYQADRFRPAAQQGAAAARGSAPQAPRRRLTPRNSLCWGPRPKAGPPMQFGRLKRRAFVALLRGAAGAAVFAWPRAARAQQREKMRRIGVLMSTSADDPNALAWISAFAQGLQERGWSVGGNVRIDYRWGAGDLDRFRKYAAELVALAPDVILATAASIVGALQQASRTVPIVFVTTVDPVGGGLVESLARPGGNATGFSAREFGLSGKLLELLKEIAPRVSRVAVIRDPAVPAGSGGFAAIQTVAPSFGVELTPIGVRTVDEIER